MYTHLEDYIRELLRSIKIHSPPELTIDNVATRLKLEINYKQKAYRHDNEIILQRGTKLEEWLLFAHEICHYLRHAGMQLAMHPLFIELQEYQANYFAYHFCVPTFMLEQLKEVTIYEIMNQFNVDEDFALRRLEMYQNRRMNLLCREQIKREKATQGLEVMANGNLK